MNNYGKGHSLMHIQDGIKIWQFKVLLNFHDGVQHT